jgi:hypothetical protein
VQNSSGKHKLIIGNDADQIVQSTTGTTGLSASLFSEIIIFACSKRKQRPDVTFITPRRRNTARVVLL